MRGGKFVRILGDWIVVGLLGVGRRSERVGT